MAPEQRPDRRSTVMGAAVAIGAGTGAALFAASDNPVWIGVGAGIGAAVGAAISSRSGPSDR